MSNTLKKKTGILEERWRIAVVFFLAITAVFSGLVYLNTLGFGSVKKHTDINITLTPKAELALAGEDEIHTTYAPNVPPPINRNEQKLFEVHIEVVEEMCEIDPKTGTRFETWGYRIKGDDEIVCGSPGPVIRGRVGDVARITLTNLAKNKEHHDIDFHAVTGPGGGAKALSVAPGETATVEVRLLYSGVFMYHCAHEDPPKHIAHGMYGMFIVDPEQLLPEVNHEWAVMQSEWYLTEKEGGIAKLDTEALHDENPSHITFNGTTQALAGKKALQMNTGEQARIYFVNQGLNLNSNFHPIGSHWDIVYPEGATHPANARIHGSQSTLVVAGGGSVLELKAQVPGDIILVDHALSRAFYKGALGIIRVSGQENTEIFESFATNKHQQKSQEESDSGGEIKSFKIEADSYYYSPNEIRVRKGDTVRISVENVQGFHDLVIDEFNIATRRLQSGESETIEFVADTVGEFEYYCSVGRHRELGQRGTIIIEE